MTLPARASSIPPTTQRSISGIPAYPLLLAAYAVLRLYSDNASEVGPEEVFGPLLLVMAATAVGQVLLTTVWRDGGRAAILTAAVVAPFLCFRLVADAVAFAWPYEPISRPYLVVLLAWITFILLGLYVALRIGRHVVTITQGLNVLAIVLVVLTLPPVAARALSAAQPSALAESDLALGGQQITTEVTRSGLRDIYHLVLDRYGSDEALLRGLGIDNSQFTDWLVDQGFQVVRGAHANFERTALSLSSTLGMTLHGELAERMDVGSWDLGPLYDILRRNPAAAVLQQAGYRYVHIGSWFYPTAVSEIADELMEPSFTVSFGSTLLDQTAIGGIRAIVSSLGTFGTEGTAAATERQLQRLKGVAAEEGPKYVFAHLLIPHEPYLFLADGRVDPLHASFRSQLAFANAQLRAIIEPLLALPPDQRPIIILQADEGPYPRGYLGSRATFDWSKATADEVVTKFGVLNAMYLPGREGEGPVAPGTTLVNTYPEIFQRYLGLDVPRAPDRVFAMGPQGPYDLLEITVAVGQPDGPSVRLAAH